MANVFFDLPTVAGNGPGTAVDVSSMGALKTVTVAKTGGVLPPSVTIEFACDAAGLEWTPLKTFQGGGQQTFQVACLWMRAVVSNYKGGGAPNCDVSGDDSGTTALNLPVTAGNGTGAPVNVSALPNFKTIQVGGPFRGAVNIDISSDGIDYETVASFSTPKAFTAPFAAQFMRVVRVGVPQVAPGLPVVNVAACDFGGGGGVAGIELENEGAAVAGGPFTTLDSLNVGIVFSNEGAATGGVRANPPYVDLRFPPYNVVANDPTPAVAAANTAGINAAILAFTGTDACLALPQGDIYVDQAAVSANWSIIFGTGISRLTLMGWGKRGTRIVQNGDGDLGEWDAILIDGASDIELKNFGVLQGTITNPDPGQQNHLIVVANNILGGTTQNIVCHDLWFGKCLGDGFRLLSDNAGDVVENIELRDCEMELNGIVNVPSGRVGARSGIALQRGWRDVRIINVKISGAQNSAFDSEPTGPVGIIVDTLLIDGMEIDNTLGNTNSPCSVAGNLNERLKNITIRNLKIFGGKLEVRNVDNTLFENPSIETTVPPAADVTDALITIRGVNVNGLTFINPIVNRLGTSAAGRCIDSDGAITDLLTIEGGVSRQGTASYPILLNGCTTLVIRNHEARYSSATSPAGISMVLLSMTDSNCQPTIDGLIARSTHATKFRGVIDSQVRAPRTLSNPQYINIDAPNVAEWGVITGVGVAAVNDPSPLIEDNNWGTQTIAWKSEDAGENPTTTLYPIVSGNKGTLTSRRIEGLTTPNGNVVGNLGDVYVWRPTTTTAERWFKATETVAGTPDNTGWILDTSTPSTDQVFQYTATGLEPDLDDLVIALPAARASANYAVFPAQEQFSFLLSMGVLTASKTVAQFVLSLSAAATAGDVFSFLVKDL